jgi:hypothetical protein
VLVRLASGEMVLFYYEFVDNYWVGPFNMRSSSDDWFHAISCASERSEYEKNYGPKSFRGVGVAIGWKTIPVQNLVSDNAIAQAVSRRLPTVTARDRTQLRSCGICGGKSEMGQVFFKYFVFPINSDYTECSTHVHSYTSETLAKGRGYRNWTQSTPP